VKGTAIFCPGSKVDFVNGTRSGRRGSRELSEANTSVVGEPVERVETKPTAKNETPTKSL
jgi:hypothetical protein